MKITPQADTVPPELVDRVIDHLFDDKSSLASCALVCKDWLSTSRYHLFRAINLQIPQSGEPVFQQFTQFLQDTPVVCSLIRELRWAKPPCSAYLDAPCAVLSETLVHLPNLQSLYLDGVVCSEAPNDFHTSWNTHQERVLRTVVIRNLYLQEHPQGIPSLIHTLHLFSNVTIDYFSILETWWNYPKGLIHPTDALAMVAIPHNLRVASFGLQEACPDTAFWVELLRQTRSIEILFSLNLTYIRASDVPYVGALIREVAPHLLHLRIDISLLGAESHEVLPDLNIEKCTSLVSLHLLAHGDGMRWGWRRDWSMARCIIERIPSTIQRISIAIEPAEEAVVMQRWMEEGEWEGIDKHLAGFKHLSCVQFISGEKDRGEVLLEEMRDHNKAVIVKTFPRLSKAGKVRF